MAEYNKLVRDKIVEIIQTKGEKAAFHVANEAEYKEKLKEKLQEEVAEYLKDENEEELADILEVIDALIEANNFREEAIRKIKEEKANKKGKFKEKIILESA